jgi:hypothetical protein
LTSNHFQDKCPFLLGTDEKFTVFNGIINVYTIATIEIYAANIYGINSGLFCIFIILNIGWQIITNNAI